MKKRFALLFALIASGTLVLANNKLFFDKKSKVYAKVINLNYEPIKVYNVPTYNKETKTVTIKHLIVPEAYLVTIEYGGYSETLDNQRLYNIVRKGDYIPVILLEKYDAKGNLLKKALRLPNK